MKLLFANDKRGEYPQSYYADSAEPLPRFPELRGEVQADVCVVGGGYTGLSTALHLAERGMDVVLVEAQRVGFGASGRNGGHVGTGFNMRQQDLEKLTSPGDAKLLWDLAGDAKSLTKSMIERFAPDAGCNPGIAHVGLRPAEAEAWHRDADYLAKNYGYDQFEPLDAKAMRAVVGTDRYQGGVIDWGSAHIHPLRYALGLARGAAAAGARIFEGSYVHRIRHEGSPAVFTDRGRVLAKHVVLAGNGYLGQLDERVARKVMPINNFMIATVPLGDLAETVLAKNIAVDDSKFVVNYFHLSEDRRLIFGGGESYGYKFPKDIVANVRPRMVELFPQLRDTPITHGWGGTLAITMSRLPHVARPHPNVYSSSGYSGYGVALSGLAGKLMAEAICGETERFDLFEKIPSKRFPGGPGMSKGLLALAMTWYSMRDKLGV